MQQIGLSNQRLKVVWFVIYPCFSYVLSIKYVSLNPNLKKKYFIQCTTYCNMKRLPENNCVKLSLQLLVFHFCTKSASSILYFYLAFRL